MGNIRWTPKEIDRIKLGAFRHANRAFVVQLMDAETKEIIKEERINKWNTAHKVGAKLIKDAPDGMIVRIYDSADVTQIDFLTKERVKKLNEGGHYLGDEENSDEE